MNIRTKQNLNALVIIREEANITCVRSTHFLKWQTEKTLPQGKAYISAKTHIGNFRILNDGFSRY